MLHPAYRKQDLLRPGRCLSEVAPQMRHYLGGEEVHVPAREVVAEDAELEEGHENTEAGA